MGRHMLNDINDKGGIVPAWAWKCDSCPIVRQANTPDLPEGWEQDEAGKVCCSLCRTQ